MKLNEYQRLNLLNQYRILHELSILRGDKDGEERYDNYMTILANGYEKEYSFFSEVLSETFPAEESEFVWETLQMYSAIYYSYDKLTNTKIKKEDIIFPGFDGNNEYQHYAFCDFILKDLKRFDEISNNRADFNSHAEKCPQYRRMLLRWESMGRPMTLSEQAIESLINA